MVREGLRGVEGAVEVDISKIHCIYLGNSQRKKIWGKVICKNRGIAQSRSFLSVHKAKDSEYLS